MKKKSFHVKASFFYRAISATASHNFST